MRSRGASTNIFDQHLRSPGGHSPMPMASGGGGSISRLSITCTSARYPTASATLTTPVGIERRTGLESRRRSHSNERVFRVRARASRGFALMRHVVPRDNDRDVRRGGPFVFGTHR